MLFEYYETFMLLSDITNSDNSIDLPSWSDYLLSFIVLVSFVLYDISAKHTKKILLNEYHILLE